MAMKKFNLFTTENNDTDSSEKNKDATKEIIDVNLMSYIIKEFSEVSEDIKDSLENLRTTLEKSIDYIEDKSTAIIKENRNFDLSGKYRQASLELHSLGNNLSSYIQWINTTSESNISKAEEREQSEMAYLEDFDIQES